MSDNASLSAKQTKAITLLVAGHPVEDVAAHIDVNPRTLYRWLRQSAFDAELHHQRLTVRASLRADALAKLHNDARRAADTLIETMTDPAVSARVRVQAAEAVLSRVLGQIELDDLAAEVAELKRVLHETQTFNR